MMTGITVIDFQLSPHEKSHDDASCECLIEYVPEAIFVQVDDCDVQLLPCSPCGRHENFTEGCPDCRQHPCGEHDDACGGDSGA